MKVAIGSDMPARVVDAVVEYLRERGYEVVLVGAAATGREEPWPEVAREVAERVAREECDEGIVLCWTGTGVAIAANKVPGVRAALCADPETARGARKWNHANVLAMSIRLTTEYLAEEILDAWFSTPYDEKERPMVEMVEEIEREYSKRAP